MSLLAERKRKQQLNPRRKYWSEDSNAVGQKMMEKMGWASGKGIGAKEDGIKDQEKFSYKNDDKGLPCKVSDDQWTKHESNFTQLLNSLSGTKENGSVLEKIESKVESLEKKSQSSRVRVHYHKFTRGKDLSRYSENDLASIFGKKSLKKEKKGDNNEESDEKNPGNKRELFDFFKDTLSNRQKYTVNAEALLKKKSEPQCDTPNFGFGFNGANSKNQVEPSFVSYIKETKNGELQDDLPEVEDVKIKKKSKKRSKLQLSQEEIGENGIEEMKTDISPSDAQKFETKLEVEFTPLRKKFKNFESLNSLDDEEKIANTPIKKCKKKKKSKRKYEDENCEENKPKKTKIEDAGLTNPAFDPMFNNIVVEKHSLEVINEEEETLQVGSNESMEAVQLEEKPLKKGKSEKKKQKNNAKVEDFQSEGNGVTITQEAVTNGEDFINTTCHDLTNKTSKKLKKAKRSAEFGIENSAFDDSVNQSVSIEGNCETFEVKKKKKKVKEEGISNPCFEDNLPDPKYEQKGKRKGKNKDNNAGSLQSEESIENPNEISEDIHNVPEKPTKTKKRKKDLASAENPCFNPDDTTDCPENNTSLYEVKRKKKSKTVGIDNPGLDLTSPSPKDSETNKNGDNSLREMEMPIMDAQILLNVVSTPVLTEKDKEKPIQRRKSVRFSDVNERIFINNQDSPADLRKNNCKGIDNEAYDELGNQIENKIDTLTQQLDDFEAEIENELNEAKMEVMVGEMGDPNGENEILSTGEAKLKFRYANFGRMPPWLKKNTEKSPKSSYRHLIKGDIVLGFKHTNLHLIRGYAAAKPKVSS